MITPANIRPLSTLQHLCHCEALDDGGLGVRLQNAVYRKLVGELIRGFAGQTVADPPAIEDFFRKGFSRSKIRERYGVNGTLLGSHISDNRITVTERIGPHSDYRQLQANCGARGLSSGIGRLFGNGDLSVAGLPQLAGGPPQGSCRDEQESSEKSNVGIWLIKDVIPPLDKAAEDST